MRFTAAGGGATSGPLGHTLGGDSRPDAPVRRRQVGEDDLNPIELRRGHSREAVLQANPEQLDDPKEDAPFMTPESNRRIAAGKAISILMKRETTGSCELETASVYVAAIALPQIARSTEWSGTMTALALRAYFFLLVNIGLQAFTLAMIGTEQLLMYPFSGQMHLCDFGAALPQCGTNSTAPNCLGPGGTTLSYPRLYSYDIWSTRKFASDALSQLFPERADEIKAAMDPGEYGIENYWCRAACIFIFMMAVVDDLRGTINLARLLWIVPTKAQTWISYEPPDWASKEDAKSIHSWSELDFVKFHVSGMPLGWKVLNFLVIWMPKFLLWLALAATGFHYLMETADIVDMVVNAMALTFVLDIDEMVFARLTTSVTQHIMAQLEDMPLYDLSEEDDETDNEVLERFEREEKGFGRWRKLSLIFPKRLATILCLQVIFMWLYYFRNCRLDRHGGMVSKNMYTPKALSNNMLGLMFGVEPEAEPKPFWTMPGE